MAFGKISKQDLIDAGLDPDKLATFQANGVTKEDLAAMKTELATSLATSVTDMIKAGFTELENKLKPTVGNTGNNNNNTGNNGNTGNDDVVDDQTKFLTDPAGFVNEKIKGVTIAAAIEFKRQSRDMAWREGLRTLKGLSNETLRAEIEEEWKKYTPETMVRMNTDPVKALEQIHDMIIGKNHEKIQHDTNKREGKYNLIHSGAGSSTGNTGAITTGGTNNKEELSDAEKIMARKFGMTDEEWIKQGEDMEQEEVDRRQGMLVGGKS